MKIINVTLDDIKNGFKGGNNCPISLALARDLNIPRFKVATSSFGRITVENKNYRGNDEIVDFVYNYDRTREKHVHPFSFDLDSLEEMIYIP